MCKTTLAPDSNISTVFPLNSRLLIVGSSISPPQYRYVLNKLFNCLYQLNNNIIKQNNIIVAERLGKVRFSPHVYISAEQIADVLRVLARV
jgi:hypothetical protein